MNCAYIIVIVLSNSIASTINQVLISTSYNNNSGFL